LRIYQGYGRSAWWLHLGYPAFSNAGFLFFPSFFFCGEAAGITEFNLGYPVLRNAGFSFVFSMGARVISFTDLSFNDLSPNIRVYKNVEKNELLNHPATPPSIPPPQTHTTARRGIGRSEE
jgi:hypothetical protein